MSDHKLGFIGGGNMSGAIIGGLIDSGVDPSRILVSEPSDERREVLTTSFAGCQLTSNNTLVASQSGTVILGVKPQVLSKVCAEIRDALQSSKPLVVSIAAGVRSADIDRWCGGGLSIVRTMPNQPALLRKGMTGLFANAACSDEERARSRDILDSIGSVVEVENEADLDVVTAVSGSGPVYYYTLIAAMIDFATEHGLDTANARTLATATAAGSAALAAAADESMDTLIANVRSPGGTTAAALDALEDADVRAIFRRALDASKRRGAELADEAAAQARQT
jgi:pyrroline-5-carboxylate reductase